MSGKLKQILHLFFYITKTLCYLLRIGNPLIFSSSFFYRCPHFQRILKRLTNFLPRCFVSKWKMNCGVVIMCGSLTRACFLLTVVVGCATLFRCCQTRRSNVHTSVADSTPTIACP